jgi:SAM-dependent methyltransferase
MRCEICKGASTYLWVSIAGYDHYRCRSCRYLFVYPRPAPSDLDRYYEDATFYEKAENDGDRLVREAQHRVRLLNEVVSKNCLHKRLLDVGCASGIFLEQARDDGWSVDGVELSGELARRAKDKGLAVKNGHLEELELGQYSVVTAWEVIEHAIEPTRFLEKLSRHVPKGGIIALSTPLSDGLPARVLKSRFPMLSPPEHLSLFSRKAMTMVGERLALEVIHFRSFSNLGRENLSKGMSRYVFDALRIPPMVSRGLSASLALLMFPGSALMDRLGIGSEMEIFFRRAA